MKNPIPLPLLFLLFLLFSPLSNAQRPGPVPIHVGLVLNMGSWVGKTSRTCVDMAISDFYAANPNYKTRIEIRERDSEGDVVVAASAVIDLIKNYDAVAILGPQKSGEAEFAAELGGKSHVPIMSFSATSPFLSPKSTPYFLRAAVSDAAQAEPIAALIKYFGWRQVVPIYENSEFGTGVVPFLIDAVKIADCRVPYRSVLPPSATDDFIKQELYKLKTMQTRVFIVHMGRSLGVKLFAAAAELEMMDRGYAWIITDSLTSQLGSIDEAAKETMQGVLGVRPYIPKVPEEFKRRWRREFQKENPGDDEAALSEHGLWAYDAVSVLAMAVESAELGSKGNAAPKAVNGSNDLVALPESPVGKELLDAISRTQLPRGLSGQFKLVDGELACTTFQIVNLNGEKERQIGFWTEDSNLTRSLSSDGSKAGAGGKGPSSTLGPVIWPGEENVVPKGWVQPMAGRKLRIAVPGPVEPGFHSFLKVESNPETKEMVVGGFVIEVFEAAVKELPYAIMWEYVPYQTEDGKSAGNYNDLVHQVLLQKFDGVVGDITITANRSQDADFTLPYSTSGISMVVPNRDDRSKNAWIFLRPLTKNLWIVSGAFFVFTGSVVWVLEHRINDEFRGEAADQIGTVFYFSFSTLVFAHREKVLSNLSRLVVVIWLFVVLILQSSYTASLTSMLTVQQFRPTVAEISDLLHSQESVGYLEDSFVKGVLTKMGFEEKRLKPYKSPQEYADALAKGTANGGVGAIIDEIPYLKVFLKDYCSNYTMTGRPLKTGGFGFVFPKGSPLVPDLSRAILNITEGDKMVEIERRWFGDPTSCPDSGSSISSNSLDFASFWGLFLITGVVSTVAFSAFLLSFVYKKRRFLCRSEGGRMRQRVTTMAKAFDQKSKAFYPSEIPISSRHSMASPWTPGSESPFDVSTRGPVGQATPMRAERSAAAAAPGTMAGFESPLSISNMDQEGGTPPPGIATPHTEGSSSVEMSPVRG